MEKLGDAIRSTLPGVPADSYGEAHSTHILEMYKLYLEMTDRISARRERANSFFLTLNTGITAFVGYVAAETDVLPATPWVSLVAVAGIALSYLWYRIIRSYCQLNSAKFLVVHEIEHSLPIRPYDAEWEAAGRGRDPKRYLPFTHIEIAIPFVFLILHVVVLLRVLPWTALIGRAAGTQ